MADTLTVRGLAVPFNRVSADARRIVFDLFAFREFNSADTPIYLNHDRGVRLNLGAATFYQDGQGVHFVARLLPDWTNVIESAYRGRRLRGCSIAWLEHGGSTCLTTGAHRIHDAELADVSLMIDKDPAFPCTWADVSKDVNRG